MAYPVPPPTPITGVINNGRKLMCQSFKANSHCYLISGTGKLWLGKM